MVRRSAKAKAKAAASQIRGEPEEEPTPNGIPKKKKLEKPEKRALPEPEEEDGHVEDFRTPLRMSRDKEKMVFGLAITTALNHVNITPLPKKPSGFVNGEWDFMLRTVIGNVMYTRNAMVDNVGSVEHYEMNPPWLPNLKILRIT